jgi:hypothetical protein
MSNKWESQDPWGVWDRDSGHGEKADAGEILYGGQRSEAESGHGAHSGDSRHTHRSSHGHEMPPGGREGRGEHRRGGLPVLAQAEHA